MTFNVGRQTPGGPTPLSKQPDKAFRSVFAALVDQTLLQGPEVEVEKIKILLVVVGWYATCFLWVHFQPQADISFAGHILALKSSRRIRFNDNLNLRHLDQFSYV